MRASTIRLLVAGFILVSGCDNPPKADASRTASEKWAPPKEAGGDGDAKAEDGEEKIAKAEDADAKAEDSPPQEEAAAAEDAVAAEAGAADAGAAGAEAGAAEAEAGAAEAGAVDEAEGGVVADAPAVPAGDPGPAFFAIDDKGVFALEGGELTQVKKAPSTLVQQMLVGPDGKPYLLAMDGVMRIEAGTAKLVAKTSFKKTGTVDAFALGSDGHVWTAGFKGVAHWDGKAWALEDKATLGAEVRLLKGIALDEDGKVWVASSNLLHVRDGQAAGAWKEVDVGKLSDRKPFFDMVCSDPKTGTIYAPASSVVVKASDVDAVEELAVRGDGLPSFGMIAFAQNGIGVLKLDSKHVARFFEGAVTTFTLGTDFTGTRVHHLAIDGQGRVWVATDAGISVLGPKDERVEWKMGSIPDLAGKVKGMLVVGAGPELPSVGEVQKGTLRGKILIDGVALGDADIEMCPEPATLIKKSPCEESPVAFTGKTGADGSFEFEGAPLGAYGIAVKVGDKWKTTLSGQYGAKMKAGETHDIGALKFKK
jgi:hypothetical protein